MKDEWNRPSRSDHYLMQLALIQAQSGGSKKRNLHDMKIQFNTKPPIKRKLTKEELEKMSQKALDLWFSRLGKKNDGDRS